MAAPASAIRAAFAPGRFGRAILAWLAASATAVVTGATLTVAFVLAREIVTQAPFPPSQWWVFLHLWRPLLIAGAILVPMLAGLPAAIAVFVIRRGGWARPRADMIAGAVCAFCALGAVVVLARLLGPMGDGP